jgi:hypothetical protein
VNQLNRPPKNYPRNFDSQIIAFNANQQPLKLFSWLAAQAECMKNLLHIVEQRSKLTRQFHSMNQKVTLALYPGDVQSAVIVFERPRGPCSALEELLLWLCGEINYFCYVALIS